VDRLEQIRALSDAGFTLIPLRGKVPCCKPGCPAPHKGCGDGWEKTPYGRWAPEELAVGNYGVALKAGDLVIDVDPKNFEAGDDPLARLKEDLGTDFQTFKVLTGRGNGGGHIYLSKPADVEIKRKLKKYPGLEFRSENQQMVGPGSLHPETGSPYKMPQGQPAKILEAPAALLDLLKKEPEEFKPGTGKYVDDAATRERSMQ